MIRLSVLMMGPALVMAAALGRAEIRTVDTVEYDIPFFMENHEIRGETLRRCHQDFRLAMTRECENAEAAGSLQLGSPMPPTEFDRKPAPKPAQKSDPSQTPRSSKGKDRAV